MNQVPIQPARGTLAQSNMMRGNLGMIEPNTGKMNSDDGGAMSKPTSMLSLRRMTFSKGSRSCRTIRLLNRRLQLLQMDQVTKAVSEQNTADYRAQEELRVGVVNTMDKFGLGGGMMELNAIMQSPDRQRYLTSIGTSKAMFSGQAPELGALAAEAGTVRLVYN